MSLRFCPPRWPPLCRQASIHVCLLLLVLAVVPILPKGPAACCVPRPTRTTTCSGACAHLEPPDQEFGVELPFAQLISLGCADPAKRMCCRQSTKARAVSYGRSCPNSQPWNARRSADPVEWHVGPRRPFAIPSLNKRCAVGTRDDSEGGQARFASFRYSGANRRWRSTKVPNASS